MEALQPTPERLKKGDIIEWEDTEEAGQKAARVRTQTVLDRYYEKQLISQRQYDAGQRFYSLWRAAGRSVGTTGTYDVRVGCVVNLTERQAMADSHYRQILNDIGESLAMIIIGVVLLDETAKEMAAKRGEKKYGAIAMLKLALDALADTLGMPADA